MDRASSSITGHTFPVKRELPGMILYVNAWTVANGLTCHLSKGLKRGKLENCRQEIWDGDTRKWAQILKIFVSHVNAQQGAYYGKGTKRLSDKIF